MSLANRLSRLQQVPRKISRAVVSLTNLIVNFQSVCRLLVITLNRIAPSFVCSRGKPPFQSDKKFPILTACLLSVKNASIQLTNTGSILKLHSSFKRMLWSMRSNPLGESRQKISILAAHSPVSVASWIDCKRWIRASAVEWPSLAYWRGSMFSAVWVICLLLSNLSIALAITLQSDRSQMGFHILRRGDFR